MSQRITFLFKKEKKKNLTVGNMMIILGYLFQSKKNKTKKQKKKTNFAINGNGVIILQPQYNSPCWPWQSVYYFVMKI